jgi:putative N6-adenine-specific DNA methylase
VAQGEVFVVVPPGTEELAAEELGELGLSGELHDGGLLVTGGLEAVYRVSLFSRLSSRVLLRVGRARGGSLAQLADGVRHLPWKRYLQRGQPLKVHVTLRDSRLRRRDTVAKKVELAIGDALKSQTRGRGAPPPEAGVWVRVERDKVELSIDTSGELLHRRGWGVARTEAPLRENLAAAVLRGCGWVPGQPLVDPMCGSGTFLLEAATLLEGHAPGSRRSFAFEHFPDHDAARWEALRAYAAPLDARSPLFGSDVDPDAVRAARSNAERAGVAGAIDWQVCDVAELEAPPGPGWVVTNPPYGERLAKGQAKAVVRRLGHTLRERFAGWGVAVVLPPRLVSAVGLPLETAMTLSNGGLRVVVAVGVVP